MKNLITSVACVLLLMALMVQFAQNQKLFVQAVSMQYVVESFGDSPQKLKSELSEILGCGEEEIRMEGGEIVVPIKEILASPAFWGLTAEDNQSEYIIRLREKASDGGK